MRRAAPRIDAIPFASADFHPFLAGWAPAEHRGDYYAEEITRRVLRDL